MRISVIVRPLVVKIILFGLNKKNRLKQSTVQTLGNQAIKEQNDDNLIVAFVE